MRMTSLYALLVLLIIAACGQQPAAPTPAPPSVPTAGVIAPNSAATPVVVVPTVAATVAPDATVVISTPAGDAVIASGRTAEGYPLLGDPAAPVTLQDYSDFL